MPRPLIWQNRNMNISSIKIRSHVYLLFSLMTVDQLLKEWSRQTGAARFNHGIFLGDILPLDSLNLNLTIVIFSILLLFLYFLVLIQLPKNVAASRLGLTFLVSGVVGNGIDRLVLNKTTDYLYLPVVNFSFNFADVCLWSGLILFAYLYIKGKISNRRLEYRQSILILSQDQLRLSFTFSLLILAAGLILGIFGAMFVSIHFADYHLNGHLLLLKYIYLHIGVTVTLSSMFFIFCLFYSHRLAGPVYGFLNYLRNNKGTLVGEFRSRDRDYFHAFEDTDKEIASSKKK